MIRFWNLYCLILGITINYCSCKQDNYLFFTYLNNNSQIMVNASNMQLNPIDFPKWKSQAFYNASLNESGWDILQVRSNPLITDEEQAYHAGYIEGYITREQIYNYYWNNIEELVSNTTSDRYKSFMDYFEKNDNYIKKQLSMANANHDPYWHQVNLVYQQLMGLTDGYNNATKDQNLSDKSLKFMHFWLFNYLEELTDINFSYMMLHKNKTNKSVNNKSNGAHCSALIKLLPGNSDVFIGHDTWTYFNQMNRILKRYQLAFRVSKNSTHLIPGMHTAFSSYPGVIGSIDDFYVMGSGLVTLETTLEVYNSKLYTTVHPDNEVLEGVRSVVANRLATDGNSWFGYFKRDNSGTYNNQWMIIDFNKFRPGFDPEDEFFTVIEQAPSKIIGFDQTNHLLQNGYWASYNIPFYEVISEITGNTAAAKNNSWFSYTECPRAKIFKKQQNKVTDMDSMLWLMRYNSFNTDPYSVCDVCKPVTSNACNAIASRCDLNDLKTNYSRLPGVGPALFGAIDAKIISFSLFSKGEFLAVGGPTTDNVPPFNWETTAMNKTGYRYQGQPIEWNFDPIITNWVLPYSISSGNKNSSDNPPTTTPKSGNNGKKKKNAASASEPLSLAAYVIVTWFIIKAYI